MTPNHLRPDVPGRLLAFLVFLLGIGLLCAVFSLAWSLFQAPVPNLNLPVKPGMTTPAAANIGAALTAFVRQLLLLAVMALAGSIIASKGVQLYFGTTQGNLPPSDNAQAPQNKRIGKAPEASETGKARAGTVD